MQIKNFYKLRGEKYTAYLGEEIKKLGFGLMRLPKLDDDTIDVEQTKNTAWINCKTRDEALAQFKTSLERTKAGYFDFYLPPHLENTEQNISMSTVYGTGSVSRKRPD